MKKIVIKFGTSTLTNGTRHLSRPHMVELARQVHQLQSEGNQVVIVSSAAIAAGKEKFPTLAADPSLATKQMLASIGQLKLMRIWTELFAIYGVEIGQILLTRTDLDDPERNANARNTIHMLLAHQVIPIVNENDTVVTEEITVGDNDNLSAHVAKLIQADLLILLTDQDGFYTADPRLCPDAALIQRIERFDDNIFTAAGDSSNPERLGRGGMSTKLEAAKKASESGIATVIASSKKVNVILDVAQGKPIGTFVCASPKLL